MEVSCTTEEGIVHARDSIKRLLIIGSVEHKIIPAFGWHPWFSHQLFDEAIYNGAASLSEEQRLAHYRGVLSPSPEDDDFLLALPNPKPFGHFIGQTREYLKKYRLALVGEVGLDRSFRIPEAWLPDQLGQRNDTLTPGGREGRQLSQYRVSIEHQRKVLTAQLRLAGEMQRAVSVHGVAAHGMVYDTVAATWKGHERHVPSKRERRRAEASAAANGDADAVDDVEAQQPHAVPKPYPPRICLHSYSGPAETIKMYTAPSVPCEVFFSFSTTINAWSDREDKRPGKGGKAESAVRAVPDDRILIESDLHTAGDKMDHYLAEIVRKICEVREWELEDGMKRLGANWKRFVFGKE